MSNDITALALLVSKAKASVFTMEYISQFEASDIDSDDVDLRFEVDGVEAGTNVSIVDECGQAALVITALVEALEKAQRNENLTEAERQAYLGLIRDRDARIAELEPRTVTIELPLPSCTYADHSYPAYSKQQVVNILAAAGIQVIEGDA